MNQRNVRSTGIRKLPSGKYQITFRDGNGVKRRGRLIVKKTPGPRRMNGALRSHSKDGSNRYRERKKHISHRQSNRESWCLHLARHSTRVLASVALVISLFHLQKSK